jgi:hypothetical protein
MIHRMAWVETIDPFERNETAIPSRNPRLDGQFGSLPKRLSKSDAFKLPGLPFNSIDFIQLREPYFACAEQNVGFHVAYGLRGLVEEFFEVSLVDLGCIIGQVR